MPDSTTHDTPEGAVDLPRIVRLFEAADATNEEAYYTLGIWSTLEEAVTAISGCCDPCQLGSDGEHEEYCYVEIREREMGWSGLGKVVWKITWRAKYTEESDEYTWEVDADPLPNAQIHP